MREQFRRRKLPHWDLPGATYFITACLAGSIPAEGLLEIRNLERALSGKTQPPGMTEHDWRRHKWKLIFAASEEWLDVCPQYRHLSDDRLAAEVQSSLYHFAGERYDLLAYVIMPSHFHWLFKPRPEWIATLGDGADHRSPRERIMQSIQRFSGQVCNRLLGRQGQFWARESYDHVVRDEDEMIRILDYIELNPVKRGWVDQREKWRFSSGYDRAFLRPEELSQPLTKDLLGKIRRA